MPYVLGARPRFVVDRLDRGARAAVELLAAQRRARPLGGRPAAAAADRPVRHVRGRPARSRPPTRSSSSPRCTRCCRCGQPGRWQRQSGDSLTGAGGRGRRARPRHPRVPPRRRPAPGALALHRAPRRADGAPRRAAAPDAGDRAAGPPRRRAPRRGADVLVRVAGERRRVGVPPAGRGRGYGVRLVSDDLETGWTGREHVGGVGALLDRLAVVDLGGPGSSPPPRTLLTRAPAATASSSPCSASSAPDESHPLASLARRAPPASPCCCAPPPGPRCRRGAPVRSTPPARRPPAPSSWAGGRASRSTRAPPSRRPGSGWSPGTPRARVAGS